MRLANPFSSPELRRLCAALVISCLLHVMLIAALIPNFDDYVLATADTDQPIVLKARFDIGQSTPNHSAKPAPAQAQRHEPDPQPESASEFSPAQQLSKRPRLIGTVDLEIPESDLLTEAGTLVLKLWISPLGRVEKIEVDKGTLPKAFAEAAAEVFRRARFEPGEIDGRAAGSILKIEIRHETDSEREPAPGAEPSQ